MNTYWTTPANPTAQLYQWRGLSQRLYPMEIFRPDTSFNDAPAVYIFAKFNFVGGWTALYVGETEALGRRMAEHRSQPPYKWATAQSLGATAIHAMKAPADVKLRRTIETDLIAHLSPTLNETSLYNMFMTFPR